jgi:hypothetical protein
LGAIDKTMSASTHITGAKNVVDENVVAVEDYTHRIEEINVNMPSRCSDNKRLWMYEDEVEIFTYELQAWLQRKLLKRLGDRW